jgi:hypothetical protein
MAIRIIFLTFYSWILTNFTKCIEIYQRKLLLSPNSLVKLNAEIAVGLLANSVVAQSSRAVTQPSQAIRFGEQLKSLPTAIAFH